jgi:hypothetical protein
MTSNINDKQIYGQPVYNAYDESENITWHRLGKTNDFGWSISYKKFGSVPENFPKVVEMTNAVKAKNPGFNFFRRYWMEVKQQQYDDKNNVNNDSLLNYESVVKEEINNIVSQSISPNINSNMVEGYNDNKGIIKLYHRISSKSMQLPQLINSVSTKGLIPNDNGEVGNAIWFSDNYQDYGKNGKFVVSLDFDTSTNGVTSNEFEIVYDGHNAYAHKPIPFDRLIVEKIPTAIVNIDHILTNKDLIEYINSEDISIKGINTGSIRLVVFTDVFNKYVQPFINVKDFLLQVDRNRVKMFSVL